jgi:hypothetical protein
MCHLRIGGKPGCRVARALLQRLCTKIRGENRDQKKQQRVTEQGVPSGIIFHLKILYRAAVSECFI